MERQKRALCVLVIEEACSLLRVPLVGVKNLPMNPTCRTCSVCAGHMFGKKNSQRKTANQIVRRCDGAMVLFDR